LMTKPKSKWGLVDLLWFIPLVIGAFMLSPYGMRFGVKFWGWIHGN
jgi:hypothetical protein